MTNTNDMREAFEREAKKTGRFDLQRNAKCPDDYWHTPTQQAWAGFQLAWQSQQAQGEAEAVQHFVNSMIDAFECGFIDSNTLTLATIYQVMRNHCKDGFGIEVEPLVVAWGETTARECAAPPAPAAVPESIDVLRKIKAWDVDQYLALPHEIRAQIQVVLDAAPQPAETEK